jgi:RHS repeat-associated protein
MSYMDDPITSETTEGFGLMFFNARWLDPQLGRFTQADSIVPGGVQGLDRYAYANNSPLVYIDPSGHDYVPSGDGSAWNSIQADLNWQVTNPNGVLNVTAEQGALKGAAIVGIIGGVAGGILSSPSGPFAPLGSVWGIAVGTTIGGVAGAVVGYVIDQATEAPQEDVAAIASLMDLAAANASYEIVDYYFETEYTYITDPDTGAGRTPTKITTFYVFDENSNKWLSYQFQSEKGLNIILDTFKNYDLKPDQRYKSKVKYQ